MKGYVIWLFVALACNSMADDTEKLKAELDELDRSVRHVWQLIKKANERLEDETAAKYGLRRQIPKIQKELLDNQLELAKVNVKLEQKNLQLEQCLNPAKNTEEDINRLAKERADKIAAEEEGIAKEALREKINKLLQLLALAPIEKPKLTFHFWKV
ncbi:hypothetical protein KR032_009984 [Drosophila birchii]|nr:hypothetical protein KR032_009984 [Drosophila birchii]